MYILYQVLLSLLLPPPFPSPLPCTPLKSMSLKIARGLGSAVSCRSGVWGGTPAETEFGAF